MHNIKVILGEEVITKHQFLASFSIPHENIKKSRKVDWIFLIKSNFKNKMHHHEIGGSFKTKFIR